VADTEDGPVQTRPSANLSPSDSLRKSYSKCKVVTWSLTPALVVALLIGIGFLLGRHVALRDMASNVDRRSLAATLGRVLENEYDAESRELGDVRAEFALAYLDPEKAVAEMDDYAGTYPRPRRPSLGTRPHRGATGMRPSTCSNFVTPLR